jgi:F-type H+-transporting ATPase subunit b
MRRSITTGAVALVVLAFAARARAELHGDESWTEEEVAAETHGEPGHGTGEEGAGQGAGHGGGHHLGRGDGLPADAINWADFTYAGEPAAEGVPLEAGPPVLAYVINFILLLVIIYLIARKPLAAFLQDRSATVKAQLEEAQKMLEQANERLADYSAKLERMDEEMTRLRAEFIAAGEAERDRLIAESGAKAERMREDARLRIQQEIAQLREEVRIEMIERAVAAATEALVTQVKEPDQRKLADDYVERLEREGLGQ